MKNFSLTSCFGTLSKLLLGILIVTLTRITVNAQIKFTQGVIIYKVDSVLTGKPKDSIDITLSEIKLFKKNNLFRADVTTVQPKNPENFNTFSEIINEKGKYFLYDPQLGELVKKLAVLLTIDDIKQGRAELGFKGKIREFTFKTSSQKYTLLNIPVKKMYRIEKEKNETLELALAEDIKTSFGFFFPEYLKLDGTPLQFYYEENDILYHLTAESVTEMAIDDDLFTIGPEYDIFPLSTVLSSFGKN
ncbi:hypothetical protein [Dyadobacter sp. 3J3]|uniref:hypothetical protein n=1 Tax=Dyadobacter sp. 3J3 TaxID=2606600 RepID=UPI001359677C|nr:hypothetical protein [Dyadobacter sp. 3J3]